MRTLVGITLLACTLATAAPARAASIDADARLAELLAAERTSQLQERRSAGWVLMGFGVASALAGGVAAGVGYEDPWWLGAGLGTASWGVINALASLALLELGGASERRIAIERLMRGSALDRARADAARDQYGSASILALNAGLDVFYIATGILLAILAPLLPSPEPALEGYGAAMAAQGTGLLAYDLVNWILAAARGDRLHELGR